MTNETFKISGLSLKTSLQQRYNDFLTGNPGNPYYATTYSSSSNNQYYQRVGFDSSGNIYCLGYYIDPGLIIAKYNSTGDLQWAKKLTTTNTGSYEPQLAVSSGGNCYIVCADPGTASRINLIKVDNSGSLIYQKYLDSADYDEKPFVQLDSGENIWLGFDATGGGYAFTTIKLNTAAAIQTSQKYTDGNINFACGFGLDSSTNYYNSVRWSITGTVYDFILEKFNSSFSFQWIRKFATGVNIYSFSSFTDSSGNTYAGISYASSPRYIYLVKYDSSGNLSWQRKITDSGNIDVNAITADSSGNSYLAISSGALLKYNSSGTLQWQRSISNFVTNGLKIDSSGNINLVGNYTNTSNKTSSFLITYPTDGNKTGTFTVGSASFTIGTSSYTDASGTGTGSTPTGFNAGTPIQTISTPTVWSISTLSDTSTKASV